MPPEQAKGRPIDERADVFAVGATMFKLLTGRYLHDAAGAFDLLMKQAREPAPPLASILPDVPRGVAMVIDRALTFDREQRYPNAHAMLDDVRAVRKGAAPPNATQLAGDVDRAATTQETRPAESPAAETKGPATSDEIPIFLSGFSSIADAVSTDRELGAPPDEEITTPKARPRPSVETTMISPGNEPKDE
jgi:serine/threonine protein kinase